VWSAQANRWLARKPVCREARPNGLSRSELPPFDFKTAYELYHLLIAPVSEDIKSKNILVVSSGILNSLPLGVLLTKEPNAQFATTNEDYRRANWFSTSYAFSMLPSVSSLQSRRSSSSEFAAGSGSYLGFGDPLLSGRDGSDRSAWAAQTCATTTRQFLSDGSRIIQQSLEKFFRGGLANVQQVRQQEPIPETADELCSIARDLNTSSGDIYLGERATEKNLKELSRTGALRRFRIIHFATHALLAGETEEIAHSLAEPALILSPPEVATEGDDGLLTASEVAQLDINADWVILSACNTAAAGIKTSAEALSGLARAFFYAGARALLVSHWYVESHAAASLTKETLAELKIKPDISRSEGLRYAMLKLVARGGDWAHPALWGPFVVVGANSR
jgi:CHAT domain-containing protein